MTQKEKQMVAETTSPELSEEETLASASFHDVLEWHGIPWYRTECNVRRLQARIVKATQEKRWGKVKALQRLLTHSFSGKALAVRRVTENQGKKTPGVDKVIWDTPEKKAQATHDLKPRGYHPQPLRRVYIPKSNGAQRPLSIPTMKDRAMQALYLLALQPVAETLADPHSYGFRPQRCTADALVSCHILLSQKRGAEWVLEGDIKSCFDKISHDWLLAHIPTEKTILRKWLKAGYMEKNVLHLTEEGTPQGGIISPAIANMALDGLSQSLLERFPRSKQGNSPKVNLARYADDFVVTGASKELLEQEVKPFIEMFLKERGLQLSSEKTVVTHIKDGFDFLGQHVRKYKSGAILTTPSKKNVKAFLKKVSRPMHSRLLKLFGEDLTMRLKSATLLSLRLRRRRKGMPTTPFLPLPDGLEIICIRETENQMEVQVLSHRSRCLCPGCSVPSQAIHSYYRRHPMELPCTGRRVRIILSVKKFFCHNSDCSRKVFTERIPELIEPSSRLTTRLRTLVQTIGIAFNANGGARLAEQMGVLVSRRTVLFSVLLLPVPPVGQIKRVGIDDFAWKRGVRYGTVLIDLDTHDILDILADRETESVKKWLQSHPEIEVVSRDRGGAYADGAAQGAPQAIQCADRWHICKNLGDAVENYLKRHPLSIPASPPVLKVQETVAPSPTYEQRKQQRLTQANFERKQEMVEKVREMHQQGISGHGIAAELHLARGTVRKYLQIEGPVRQTPRTRQPSLLDPHYDYLCQRWNEDTPTALHLFEELQQRGFQGGLSIVKDFVTRLRRGLPGMKHPPKSLTTKRAPRTLSPRELRWILAKKEENLTSEEKQNLVTLLESSQEIAHLYRLIQSFLSMLRERKPELLNGWMKEARESAIQELVSFVNGIERDYEAVRAGLTHAWNQGPVEGTVNKIKTHKRLMYGRASFSLLRTKMLHQKVP